jgi:hypothetical protein
MNAKFTRVTELTSRPQCNALEARIHRQNRICGNMTRGLKLGLKRVARGGEGERWVLKAPWDNK